MPVGFSVSISLIHFDSGCLRSLRGGLTSNDMKKIELLMQGFPKVESIWSIGTSPDFDIEVAISQCYSGVFLRSLGANPVRFEVIYVNKSGSFDLLRMVIDRSRLIIRATKCII